MIRIRINSKEDFITKSHILKIKCIISNKIYRDLEEDLITE